MSEKQFLIRMVGNIDDLNVIGVHIYGFIAYRQFFKFVLLSYYVNPCIINVKLVFPFEQEFVLIWLFVIEHY